MDLMKNQINVMEVCWSWTLALLELQYLARLVFIVCNTILTRDRNNSIKGRIVTKKVNLLTVVAQCHPDQESNPRPLDRISDA